MQKIKKISLAAGLALGLLAGTAAAADAQALAEQKGCLGCHAIDQQVAGPSLKSIAAKFKGQAGATEKIVGVLQSGEGHPPIEASKEDLTTIVNWVLAM